MTYRRSTSLPRLASLLLLPAVLAGCGAPPPPPLTGRTERQDIDSAIVGDTYRIDVRLPPGYDSEPGRRWPVAYQLDGTSFGPEFLVAAGHASELAAQGTIPEVIVVGVGYPYEAPPGAPSGRWRDYMVQNGDRPGGIDTFLRFLRDELVPYVDSRYRTSPSQRALIGHSLGGFAALYAMLTTAGDGPFTDFVGGDPSTGHGDLRLMLEEQKLAARTRSLPVRLHFEIARYDGAVQQLFFQQLSERLDRDFDDLTLSTRVTDTDHLGAIASSIRNGLAFTFGDIR